MGATKQKMVMDLILLSWVLFALGASAWTGEIHGRVVCDICGDSSLGPEDHVLEGIFIFNWGLCEFYIVLIEFMKLFFPLLLIGGFEVMAGI